jgi:hypothetical protein
MVNSTHDMTEDIGEVREAEDGRLVMVTRDCEWLRLPAMALDAAGIAALREVLDCGVEEIQGYQEYTADDEDAEDPFTDEEADVELGVPDGTPFPGRPGYVTGQCGHAVAGSEWRAGFRNCERCGS